MSTRRYEGYGINWMFYLEGNFNDEAMTVEVTREYRLHKFETTDFPRVEGGEFFDREKDGKKVIQIRNIEGGREAWKTYERI